MLVFVQNMIETKFLLSFSYQTVGLSHFYDFFSVFFKDFYKADTVDEERLLTIFDQLEYACIQGVRDNYSYYAFILSYMYLRKTPKYDTTTAYAWALVNDWMEGISYGGWSYKVPSYDPEFAAEAEAMAILFINLYLDKFEPGTATRSQMVFRREKDD